MVFAVTLHTRKLSSPRKHVNIRPFSVCYPLICKFPNIRETIKMLFKKSVPPRLRLKKSSAIWQHKNSTFFDKQQKNIFFYAFLVFSRIYFYVFRVFFVCSRAVTYPCGEYCPQSRSFLYNYLIIFIYSDIFLIYGKLTSSLNL